jgi:hypothetical protein
METKSDRARSQARQGAHFAPVRDGRNRRISGLYRRANGITVNSGSTGTTATSGPRRFPLLDDAEEPIRTLTEAKVALDTLKARRREEKLPATGRRPLFADFANDYLLMASTRAKNPGTLERNAGAFPKGASWAASN